MPLKALLDKGSFNLLADKTLMTEQIVSSPTATPKVSAQCLSQEEPLLESAQNKQAPVRTNFQVSSFGCYKPPVTIDSSSQLTSSCTKRGEKVSSPEPPASTMPTNQPESQQLPENWCPFAVKSPCSMESPQPAMNCKRQNNVQSTSAAPATDTVLQGDDLFGQWSKTKLQPFTLQKRFAEEVKCKTKKKQAPAAKNCRKGSSMCSSPATTCTLPNSGTELIALENIKQKNVPCTPPPSMALSNPPLDPPSSVELLDPASVGSAKPENISSPPISMGSTDSHIKDIDVIDDFGLDLEWIVKETGFDPFDLASASPVKDCSQGGQLGLSNQEILDYINNLKP
ncbi:hypothetical protein EB796_005124 [Bugula neritina]|uniref:Uncharacterized protein n=1 Tax=Bugula neritina TaxID=10212 RepID=A0A7J7KFY8_BUGNE|nr:hypothetical protein EB796_005124 [Bugula neritina]